MAELIAPVTPDVILAIEAPLTQPITACALLRSLRASIPDPTRDPVTGQLDPMIDCTHDGVRFSNATLLSWMSDGLIEVVKATNWRLEDWWAMPARAAQPTYELDRRWHQIIAAYAYQRQCVPLPQQYTISPAQGVGQPLTYGTHRRVTTVDVSYWPAPESTDPTTVLVADLGPQTEQIMVASSAGFLPFGWVRIDGELIQYQAVQANTLLVTRRGCAGTLAVPHYVGATVTHCSLWVKGKRIPTEVTTPDAVIEVPPAYLVPVKTYVRAQVKGSEQDDEAELRLLSRFYAECDRILIDSVLQSDLQDGTQQVRMYGTAPGGWGLLPYGPFGTIVP